MRRKSRAVDQRLKLPSSKMIKLGPAGAAFYKFNIPPQHKQRTRAGVSKNGKSFQWTPAKTRAYESVISELTAEQHQHAVPFNTRLLVHAHFFLTSLRGDIDNLAKALLDGMQKVAFSNDCLIDGLFLRRYKIPEGERERTEVVILPIDEDKPDYSKCVFCGSEQAATNIDEKEIDF